MECLSLRLIQLNVSFMPKKKATTTTKDQNSLASALAELEKIAQWFEEQEDIDVQKGIEKVKRGAILLKQTKKQLADIENDFQEVQKNL